MDIQYSEHCNSGNRNVSLATPEVLEVLEVVKRYRSVKMHLQTMGAFV